jgi:phytanoyl-CoA hydroxylase
MVRASFGGIGLNAFGTALHELNPIFRDFSQSAILKQALKDLGYKKPELPQSMYIFKQPKIGGEVSPHQDNAFIYTEPLSTTGLWFAIDSATKENGCLWAVPGSHVDGINQRFVRAPEVSPYATKFIPPSSELAKFDISKAVPLPAEEGTMVLLDGSLVHFSEANTSSMPRHAYTLHIIETEDCEYPASNWLLNAGTTNFAKMYDQ